MADNNLRITELSYDDLRDNLKDYLKQQTKLQDYNFEGSTLSIILDMLAYNTYYNAFYANMAGNESFIDSAVLRESVVSRAKELDYTPRSAKSSSATINMNFSYANTSYTLMKDFRCKATLDGIQYHFATPEAKTYYSDTGVYNIDVDVYEGIWTTQYFTVQEPGFAERYVIANENVDTDSISVQVKASATSTQLTTYTLSNDILAIDGDSTVFFIVENLDGLYELVFGDGILGKKLTPGNQVIVNYRVCAGSAPNGIVSFSKETNLFPNYTLSTVTQSSGGQDKEGIESIRFNAPRTYDVQKRVVTIEDYKQLVLQNSDIQSLAVWGGETNEPPIYGKVFISAKPFNGFSLTQTRKNQIIKFLEDYNVQSIDPLMVDPSFVYIVPNTKVYIDPNSTTLSATDIRTLVNQTFQTFEENDLSLFDRKFRYSKLIKAIDDTDQSIKSNDTDIRYQKRFSPILGSKFNYYIRFYTPIFRPYSGFTGSISSTAFYLPGITNKIYIDDDGKGTIRFYYPAAGNTKVYVREEAGTVNYTTGEIVLKDFNPSAYEGTEIQITITPEDKDLTPIFNQILLISDASISIYDEDTGNLLSSGSGSTEGDNTSQFETPITKNVVV